MKILVCGGRNFSDLSSSNFKAEYEFVHEKLNEIIEPLSKYYNPSDNWLPTDITIISGCARGVDTTAIDWAVINFAQVLEFPADWKTYGRKAGPIRNQQMLDEGKPDLVIAFPGGTGTSDMIKRSKKAGIKTLEITYDIR